MHWNNGDLVMERNTVHKFVNSDGVTINSNVRNIKTNFTYLGESANYKKLEKLLSFIDPQFIIKAKKESKTEIGYEQMVFRKFIELTAKTNPQKYLANYAKHKKMFSVITNLTKDSFIGILKSDMHNVIDWDVQKTWAGLNYAVKVEVFTKIR